MQGEMVQVKKFRNGCGKNSSVIRMDFVCGRSLKEGTFSKGGTSEGSVRRTGLKETVCGVHFAKIKGRGFPDGKNDLKFPTWKERMNSVLERGRLLERGTFRQGAPNCGPSAQFYAPFSLQYIRKKS